jgi:hypothetical protein
VDQCREPERTGVAAMQGLARAAATADPWGYPLFFALMRK